MIGAVIIGAAGWAVPVARAMRPGASAPSSSAMDDLPYRWTEPVSDAKRALKRYRRALSQCDSGPLLDRLQELEADFEESVQRCEHLARWGAVGRARQASRDGVGGLDLGAGELASELGALRAALDEVDHIELGRTSEA